MSFKETQIEKGVKERWENILIKIFGEYYSNEMKVMVPMLSFFAYIGYTAGLMPFLATLLPILFYAHTVYKSEQRWRNNSETKEIEEDNELLGEKRNAKDRLSEIRNEIGGNNE